MIKKIKEWFKNLVKKKSFWIIVGAFGIALLSILGIYFFQPKFIPEPIRTGVKKTIDGIILGKTDNQTTANSNTTTGQKNNSNQSQGNNVDTSNWQTYTNTEFGFSIKYPESFKPQKIENTSRFTFSNEPILEGTDQLAPIELMITNENLEQEINAIKKESINGYKEETYTINGLNGKKITGTFGLFYWGKTKFTFILFEKNGQVFEWSGNTELPEVSNNFEGIISTFAIK